MDLDHIEQRLINEERPLMRLDPQTAQALALLEIGRTLEGISDQLQHLIKAVCALEGR